MKLDFIKSALIRIGSKMSANSIRKANAFLNYLDIGRCLSAHGLSVASQFDKREELYDHIAASIANQKVLYLEFGVYQGASLRYWSSLLKNPDSRLHGFDSFEGLPEQWEQHQKSAFSTNGHMPTFDDPRIQLFKGWFQDTLPDYSLPPHDVLVIHIDCDLYSSAATVLSSLAPSIKPGSYLLFDEFFDRNNELKAFDEFCRSTAATFSTLGATRLFTQVAFQKL